jgi:hypothetical protein
MWNQTLIYRCTPRYSYLIMRPFSVLFPNKQVMRRLQGLPPLQNLAPPAPLKSPFFQNPLPLPTSSLPPRQPPSQQSSNQHKETTAAPNNNNNVVQIKLTTNHQVVTTVESASMNSGDNPATTSPLKAIPPISSLTSAKLGHNSSSSEKEMKSNGINGGTDDSIVGWGSELLTERSETVMLSGRETAVTTNDTNGAVVELQREGDHAGSSYTHGGLNNSHYGNSDQKVEVRAKVDTWRRKISSSNIKFGSEFIIFGGSNKADRNDAELEALRAKEKARREKRIAMQEQRKLEEESAAKEAYWKERSEKRQRAEMERKAREEERMKLAKANEGKRVVPLAKDSAVSSEGSGVVTSKLSNEVREGTASTNEMEVNDLDSATTVPLDEEESSIKPSPMLLPPADIRRRESIRELKERKEKALDTSSVSVEVHVEGAVGDGLGERKESGPLDYGLNTVVTSEEKVTNPSDVYMPLVHRGGDGVNSNGNNGNRGDCKSPSPAGEGVEKEPETTDKVVSAVDDDDDSSSNDDSGDEVGKG